MAISAQGAVLTLGGIVMNEVVEYEVQYAQTDNSFGTVRVLALANNSVNRQRLYTRSRLVIQQGSSTVFDGFVVATGVRIRTLTNDIVRYEFDFRILWFPIIA